MPGVQSRGHPLLHTLGPRQRGLGKQGRVGRLLQKALGITHAAAGPGTTGASPGVPQTTWGGGRCIQRDTEPVTATQGKAMAQGGTARLGSKGKQLLLHWPGRLSCSLHLALIAAGEV